MSICIITGSAGLIGSEAARYFSGQGLHIVGIDNNMRKVFFGEEASTLWNRTQLQNDLGKRYTHHQIDIRDYDALAKIFKKYQSDIKLIIHAAAQPSHDWAARDPFTDFAINANGTLNLLEATRKYARDAPFIFTSTNKVYGDRPNHLPLIEQETRWEIDPGHRFANGIDETLSIDQTTHSLFGVSKASADLMVQEYGRYFDMPTTCMRGGCLSGPNHSGTQLHGFLAYLMKCAATGQQYTVFGHKGKQVRDTIHANDLIRAFDAIFKAPRQAEVYNIGGGRHSNCSMIEAIALCEKITGKQMDWDYADESRIGDHIWWISDLTRFQQHYPNWQVTYDVPEILNEIYQSNAARWVNND